MELHAVAERADDRAVFSKPAQFPATIEIRLRKLAERVSEPERLELYAILSACTPGFAATTFRIEENMVIVCCQNGREISFPRPVPMVKLSHIIFGCE